jgi:hypothetical protein
VGKRCALLTCKVGGERGRKKKDTKNERSDIMIHFIAKNFVISMQYVLKFLEFAAACF